MQEVCCLLLLCCSKIRSFETSAARFRQNRKNFCSRGLFGHMTIRNIRLFIIVAALTVLLSSCVQSSAVSKAIGIHRNDYSCFCQNFSNPLEIRTYDGSNQANHPKVIYIKKGWHGYRYWMAFTPYPFCNATLENPSVAVSNDSTRWIVPHKMPQPIINPPKDKDRGAHYSDPHLVFCNNEIQLWYRYNPAMKNKSQTDNSRNSIYMVKTKNGLTWSKPVLIFNDKTQIFSPAIINDSGIYKIWYSSTDGRLHYRESRNLKMWSKPITVHLSLRGYDIWHQDVIKGSGGYEIVFSAFRKHEFSKNNQCLYYACSNDGINFSRPVKILSPSKSDAALDNQMIYRSSLLEVDGHYILFYSAMNRNKEWHIFKADFNESIAREESVASKPKSDFDDHRRFSHNAAREKQLPAF